NINKEETRTVRSKNLKMDNNVVESNEYLNFNYDYPSSPEPPFVTLDKSTLINENFLEIEKLKNSDIDLKKSVSLKKNENNENEVILNPEKNPILDSGKDYNENNSENKKENKTLKVFFKTIFLNTSRIIIGIVILTLLVALVLYIIHLKVKKSYFDNDTQTKASDYYREYLNNLKNNSNNNVDGKSNTNFEENNNNYIIQNKTDDVKIEDKIEKLRSISKQYSGKT
ncbi:hypothetical protein KA977_11975, partial [Candidatus Dependentiae bacterium]|nr:hypothetical protein [Candidatus Dependentiae bacterium]